MDTPISNLLQQGIAAARAGKREEARTLLTQVVAADERNEQAWLWLSGVVDDPDDIRTCLYNVLDLNPGNTQARQGLAWVDSKYGPPAQPPAEQIAQPVPAVPEPPAALRPPEPPATPTSFTGPTTRLDRAPAEASAPALPKPADKSPAPRPSLPASPVAAPRPPENPCPFCGTPTSLAQNNCTQCHNNLMIRGELAATRSTALTALGWLVIVYGAITVLGGILGTLGAIALTQATASTARAGASQAIVLVPIVFGVILGVLVIRIGRALLGRARWAYFAVIALSLLSLVGLLCNILQVGGISAALATSGAGLSPALRQSAGAITTVAGVIVGIGALFQLLYFALIGLSYRDFYSAQVRFQPKIEDTEAITHYNNGIAYKKRGMWYMTIQEWLVASRKKPHDKVYLQALGLAFAQAKKLYPFSSAYLHEAEQFLIARKDQLYALAPELEQLKLFG